MTIDLSKCKPNQTVVTRAGELGTITRRIEPALYPYEVRFIEDGCYIFRTYTQEGYFLNNLNIRPQDIVEILPIEDSPGANSELLEENARLKAEIENLRIKADAYDIACDDLERYQQSRIASGKHPGTVGSLFDGMAWAYFTIDNLEVERGSLEAELESVKRQLDLLLSLG